MKLKFWKKKRKPLRLSSVIELAVNLIILQYYFPKDFNYIVFEDDPPINIAWLFGGDY